MNRGMYQSSLVQQMTGGNPSWCSVTGQEISQLLPSPSSYSSASSASPSSSSSGSSPNSTSSSSMYPLYTQSSNCLPMTNTWQDHQALPESLSQLLLGGLTEEDDRCNLTSFQSKREEKWENPIFVPTPRRHTVGVNQEGCHGGYMQQQNLTKKSSPWSQGAAQALSASSPKSCVTTNVEINMLDFSNIKGTRKHLQSDHSSEVISGCNGTSGSALKKGRVQASSAQSPLKVRKEKIGDRITALHQLVSPFGKTDTASVLAEAFGYIRFLQSQIEALSLPYLGNESRKSREVVKDERSDLFQQNSSQDTDDESKDLRSRGLCLVPVSLMLHVGSENGADYWASAFGGGFR